MSEGNQSRKPTCFSCGYLTGAEHQIPFTTYREFPKNYKPLYPHSRSYRKDTPYSDLIGDLFAFKFKGEKLPKELDFLDSQMSYGLREEYVKIFN